MSVSFFCWGRKPGLDQTWFSRSPKSLSGKIVKLHTKQNRDLMLHTKQNTLADKRRNYHVTVHEWCEHLLFFLLFGEKTRPTPNLILEIAKKWKNLQVTYETIPPPLSRELLIEKGNGNSVVAELANTENTLRRGFMKHAFLFFIFPKDLCSDKGSNRIGGENRSKRGKRRVSNPVFWPFFLVHLLCTKTVMVLVVRIGCSKCGAWPQFSTHPGSGRCVAMVSMSRCLFFLFHLLCDKRSNGVGSENRLLQMRHVAAVFHPL